MAAPYVQQSHAASVVLTVSVAAFVVGEVSQTLRLRRGVPHADLLGELAFRAVFLLGIVMLPLSSAVAPAAQLPGRAATFTLGTVLGWSGLLLRWWSFVTLGRSFTTVLKVSADQVVVDRGPYGVVRHPSYTGLLLAVVGCGVVLGNWVGVVASLGVVLVAMVYRIRIEERALVATIGEPYSRYAIGRARLVPFVW